MVPCRFDWHQTGSQVIISIYAKNGVPELSYVDANSTTLHIRVVFEGEKEFEQKISLWGVSPQVGVGTAIRTITIDVIVAVFAGDKREPERSQHDGG